MLIGTDDGGAIVPVGAVDGLTNAPEAQFLFILLDHGPAHDDPEPVDFTVFPPDPGSCVEVQFAAHH